MPTRAKTTARKPLRHRLKTYNFFLVFAIVLGMLAGVIMVRVFYQGELFSLSRPSVSLGMFQYDITGDRAVKRTGSDVVALQTFLENQIKNGGCPSDNPGIEYVRAFTTDRSQVLLDSGCGGGTRTFAMLKNNQWQSIPSTNQLDTFDVPSCTFLDQYTISKQIAPVCYKTQGSASLTYQVR